jgi:RNA polymerase sigma-70 factor (ECF subfamily)
MEDIELVAGMASGDHGAISTLYDRYGGALLGLALRIVKHRQSAEDLVHDVFLEAWRASATFDPQRGRVWTWLAIRLRSRALDVMRSARVSRNAGATPLDHMRAPDAPPSADHARVRGALAGLTTEQRRVLELAYFEGLSCREIALRDAIPVGTVKSRLASGLMRLRAQLQLCAAG